MADDYDDFFNESSDEEYCDDIDEDLDVMKATRRPLNLNNRYVAKWTIADAFREFYQNLYVLNRPPSPNDFYKFVMLICLANQGGRYH